MLVIVNVFTNVDPCSQVMLWIAAVIALPPVNSLSLVGTTQGEKPMDINPEEVINSLSSQIGALTTENTMLKMALTKMQQELQAAVVPEVKVVQEKKKK